MRYLLQVAYNGTPFAGFQIQKNTAQTIQGILEKKLQIITQQIIQLTGSSRTDAGVHAQQNFFHFDTPHPLKPTLLYNLNAVLPASIAGVSIQEVQPHFHCRFNALSRRYIYRIYTNKNPFLDSFGYYYPYPLDPTILNHCAAFIQTQTNFQPFAKHSNQPVNTHCHILQSHWTHQSHNSLYIVEGNRFLRGMVKGLVGTMLNTARGRITLSQFQAIFQTQHRQHVSFAVPSKGLTLQQVRLNNSYTEPIIQYPMQAP